MADIAMLKDKNDNQILPPTVAKAVYNGNERLDNRLKETPRYKDPLGTAPSTPRDADSLGGRTPEYYAKQSEVNEIKQNLTTQDGEQFRYAKQDGKRGYIVNEEGADTFYPFSGTIELLGQYLNSTTSNLVTVQLDKEISKYKYIIISLSALNNDSIISTTQNSLLAIADVSYFKSNVITANSYAGSTGSAVMYNNILSYVDDLSISWKRNFTSSRSLYVYGL